MRGTGGCFQERKEERLPVWFISIREPLVTLSNSLMKLASKSVGGRGNTPVTICRERGSPRKCSGGSVTPAPHPGSSRHRAGTGSIRKALSSVCMFSATLRNNSAFIPHNRQQAHLHLRGIPVGSLTPIKTHSSDLRSASQTGEAAERRGEF